MKSLAMAALALAVCGAFDEVGEAGTPGAGAATAPTKPPKEVLKVKMSDGREVEFVGKRKLLKDTIIEGSAVKVRMDFRNGETRLWTIPDSLLLTAAGHGGEQKLGDETAGEEDVDDMVMSVDALIERLNAGQWTKPSTGGGFGGASVLVKALMEVTKKPAEEIKTFLKAKVDAGTTYQKLNDAFAEDDTVGPVIKRLRKEKAGDAKVDTKALLGGIESLPAAPAAA